MKCLREDDVSYIFQCCYNIVPEIVDGEIYSLNPQHKRRRLAAKYNIKQATISCIALGKIHKEVIRKIVHKMQSEKEKNIVLLNLNRKKACIIKKETGPAIVEEMQAVDARMELSIEDENLHVTGDEIDSFYRT